MFRDPHWRKAGLHPVQLLGDNTPAFLGGSLHDPARENPRRPTGKGKNEGWLHHRAPPNQRGWLQKGGTGLSSEVPLARSGQVASPACVRSTRDALSGGPCAGCRSQNLVLGCWILKGRRGWGGGRGPAHVPRSVRGGEGVISARRLRKRAAGKGAAALPHPRGEGEVDPPRSLPSARTDAFRILPLREPEGKTGLGKGRHVGGRTPSVRWGRGPRAGSPGHAAERGTRCTLSTGIPSSTRKTPSFQRLRLDRRQGVVESVALRPRRSPPAWPPRRRRGRRQHP